MTKKEEDIEILMKVNQVQRVLVMYWVVLIAAMIGILVFGISLNILVALTTIVILGTFINSLILFLVEQKLKLLFHRLNLINEFSHDPPNTVFTGNTTSSKKEINSGGVDVFK